MRRLALQHGLMLLIHEKPFAGINGSGKHNNWSMATDDGREPARPGQRPARQRPVPGLPARGHPRRQRPRRPAARVHRRRRQRPPPGRQRGAAGDHVDLPRLAARRRHRQLEQGPASASKKGGSLDLGVTSLPDLPKDATDRNRTSPFAFTGNKFEFRAVGSSAPIYWPQTVLNTAVADSLKQLADELDKLKPGDFDGLTDDPVGHRRGQQAGPVRGQRLLRGVARRGRAPRAAEQQDDRRRAAGADDGQGEEAVLDVRRAVRARARGARRHRLGALRQGREHRGQRARSTSPGR